MLGQIHDYEKESMELERLENELLRKLQETQVQERAASVTELLAAIKAAQEAGDGTLGPALKSLFAGSLNPVSARAQRKVPVPEGLDLDDDPSTCAPAATCATASASTRL